MGEEVQIIHLKDSQENIIELISYIFVRDCLIYLTVNARFLAEKQKKRFLSLIRIIVHYCFLAPSRPDPVDNGDHGNNDEDANNPD
jgi:hypothetical protein